MLHNGHVDMIRRVLDMCDKVVLVVGSAQECGTEKNPFSHNVRYSMISSVFESEIIQKRLLIVCLNDIGKGDTSDWGNYVLKSVKEECGKTPDLYITGCEKDRTSWFSEKFAPNMDELRLSKHNIDVSASTCRQYLLDGDFESWSRYVPEEQPICEKINTLGDNVKIIATRDTHTEDYLKTQEGKYLPIKHCIAGTYGWQLNEDIYCATDKKVIFHDKPTFGSLDWPELDINIPDEIEICGTCTDICVVSNALILKAKYPNAKVIVDSALCAGLTKEKHEAALETKKSCQIEVR